MLIIYNESINNKARKVITLLALFELYRRTNKNHYVYEITNLINDKKYIGKRSCKCPIEKDKYMGSGTSLKRAFKKYGKENFNKRIIAICDTVEDAYKLEEKYITLAGAVKSNK